MDNPLGPLLERRQLLNSAVTLTALGSHFVSLLVAAIIVILLISSSQTRSWPHFGTRAFRISKKC